MGGEKGGGLSRPAPPPARLPCRSAAKTGAYVLCEGDLGVHVEDGRVVHPGPARRLPHHVERTRQTVIKRIYTPSNCARATMLRGAVFDKRI